jgi:DNA-binding XRE family transcriptional regulator
MTATIWNDIKAQRPRSAERHHGYNRAGQAIRLATELRALREKKGLSQRQLAELVGTTQSAIARLEGGRISPSLPTGSQQRSVPKSRSHLPIPISAEADGSRRLLHSLSC